MPTNRITPRVVVRYVLLQIPAFAIVCIVLYWISSWTTAVPRWVFFALLGLWVLKDVVLFPFTWEAYDWGRPGDANPLLGLQGVVIESLGPSGRVRIGGEIWNAELDGANDSTAAAGSVVTVLGMRGLTLLVGRARPRAGISRTEKAQENAEIQR